MKKLAWLVAALSALGCGDAPREVDCQAGEPGLAVSFSGETDGVVTYDNGKLLVQIKANTCGIAGSITGKIVVIQDNEKDTESDGAKAPTEFTLSEPLDPEDHNRTVTRQLTFAQGGAIRLNVHALGMTEPAEVEIETPTLELVSDRVALTKTTRTLTVCLESNAAVGNQITLQTIPNDGTSSAEQPTNRALQSGSCSDTEDEHVRHVRFSTGVTADEVWLDAKLGDSPAKVFESIATAAVDGAPELTVMIDGESAEPDTAIQLPSEDVLVHFVVEASESGDAVQGLDLTLGGLTANTFWPSLLVTDAEGKVEGYFTSPADNLVVLTWSNANFGVLSTTRLERPAAPGTTPVRVVIGFPPGSAADSDELASEDTIVEVLVMVTRDGTPVANEAVALSATGVSSFTPAAPKTGENGVAQLFFQAPEANQIVLVADAAGINSEGIILTRP